jgi:hypothetical protein
MGSKHSVEEFEFGTISIVLDEQHLTSGEKVSGSVHIKLEKAFPAEKLVI